jgi:hypothetical protein
MSITPDEIIEHQSDCATTKIGQIRTGKDLAESNLIGIWSDRSDIQNSRQFADLLRQLSVSRNAKG